MTRRAADLVPRDEEPTQPIRALPAFRDPFWRLPLEVQRLLVEYVDRVDAQARS